MVAGLGLRGQKRGAVLGAAGYSNQASARGVFAEQPNQKRSRVAPSEGCGAWMQGPGPAQAGAAVAEAGRSGHAASARRFWVATHGAASAVRY